jgi:hypothetical protein
VGNCSNTLDKGKLLLVIRKHPEPINPRAQRVSGKLKEMLKSRKTRKLGKIAATEQTTPVIILKIRI